MDNAVRRSTSRRAAQSGLIFGLALAVAVLPAVGSAYADPPPWAPAHGWRAKHKHKHEHGHRHEYRSSRTYYVEAPRTYYEYAPSVGILSGFCKREVIGTLIGAAGGGYLGSQVGKGDGRLAAVGAGVFLGALLGGAIGRSMDEVDQNCVGHALESAPDGQTVAWNNAAGARVMVTPMNTFRDGAGRYCREYTTGAMIGGRPQQIHGTSCRQPDGSWQAMN